MFEKLKYESTLVTFTEVPDEIALCFNISGCPCNCQDCFEPWLRDDIGSVLDAAVLEAEIASHPHISCVCFMGGDRHPDQIAQLIANVREKFPHLKWAMYSGKTVWVDELAKQLDYYKIGPYMPQFGPLNVETTNQIMYKKIKNDEWQDITYRFQEKKV